jgi:bifunctional DNase/RNase
MTDTTHLATLLEEYDETIQAMETAGFEYADLQAMEGQRMVLHDMIIEEVKRLGYTVRSREESVWKARQLTS